MVNFTLTNAKINNSTAPAAMIAKRIAPGGFQVSVSVVIDPNWDGNSPVTINYSVKDNIIIPAENLVNDPNSPHAKNTALQDGIVNFAPLIWTKSIDNIKSILMNPISQSPGTVVGQSVFTNLLTVTYLLSGPAASYQGTMIDESFETMSTNLQISDLDDTFLKLFTQGITINDLLLQYVKFTTSSGTANANSHFTDYHTNLMYKYFPNGKLKPNYQNNGFYINLPQAYLICGINKLNSKIAQNRGDVIQNGIDKGILYWMQKTTP